MAKRTSKHFIFILLLAMTFFIPSSIQIGGFQLWYLLIVCFSAATLLHGTIIKDGISKSVLYFVFLNCSLLVLGILFSIGNYGSVGDTNEFARLVGILCVFNLAYSVSNPNLKKDIILFFKFFLLSQLLICYLQGFNSINTVLGYIWNTDRVWLYRRTGTFANPNILSVFSIISYCFVYFYSRPKTRIFYGLVTLSIILFSSSKTGLIAFLCIISLNYVLTRERANIRTILIFIGATSILLYLLIQLLYIYQGNFPYLAQLLAFVENDLDAGTIKSIGDRQVMWDNALSHYNKLPLIQKMVGIGPAKSSELNIIDNEPLTILIKMGWMGVFLYLGSLISLTIYVLRHRQIRGAKIMLSVLAVFLLASVSASTFIAWHLSLVFFLVFGITLKEIKVYNRMSR